MFAKSAKTLILYLFILICFYSFVFIIKTFRQK